MIALDQLSLVTMLGYKCGMGLVINCRSEEYAVPKWS
jgi:hypothetical protein